MFVQCARMQRDECDPNSSLAAIVPMPSARLGSISRHGRAARRYAGANVVLLSISPLPQTFFASVDEGSAEIH